MYYRRKILLALLQAFGGSLTKINLQKYLFLFNQEKDEAYYDFIPYKFGCYSFQANQDLLTLSKYNMVEESGNSWNVKDKTKFLNQLKTKDKILVANFYKRFNKIKGNSLIKFVYENYPYYAINSIIAEDLLMPDKYKIILKTKPQLKNPTLFTLGYEGKTVEYFTNQLIKNNIKVLCDVRKNPISMKYGFSKNQLKFVTENVGIEYFHFAELGIESNKRRELNSKQDYDLLFKEYEKNTLPGKNLELEKIFQILLSRKRIALMCFEADHNYCHRSRTASALLMIHKNNYNIIHI